MRAACSRRATRRSQRSRTVPGSVRSRRCGVRSRAACRSRRASTGAVSKFPPDRLKGRSMQFVFVLFEGLTALDMIGPYEVLQRLPDAEVVFAAKEAGAYRPD